MNKIFLALSNIKFNSEAIKAGDVFEGDTETFEGLVKDGVVRIVEGAENLEQAADIVRKEVAEKSAAAATAVANAPKDTWAPSPEKPAETTTETVSAETKVEDNNSTASTTIPATEPQEVGKGDLPPAPGTDASNL